MVFDSTMLVRFQILMEEKEEEKEENVVEIIEFFGDITLIENREVLCNYLRRRRIWMSTIVTPQVLMTHVTPGQSAPL